LAKICEEKRSDPEFNDGKETSQCYRYSPITGLPLIGEIDAGAVFCFMLKLKSGVNETDNTEEGYDELSTGYVIEDACNSERKKDKSASSRSCFCNTDDDLEASCFYNRKSNQQIKKEFKEYGRALKRENPEMNTRNFEISSNTLNVQFSDKADCESEKEQGKHPKTYGKCVLKYTENNLIT